MSLRLEMLQVARLAPKLLGESSELVRDFLLRQRNSDGGFKDRTGRSDLYYTVFGIDSLLALRAAIDREQLGTYLTQYGAGTDLDFVHLCCLARCWAAWRDLGDARDSNFPSRHGEEILRRIESFRAADGGYDPSAVGKSGTVYGCFLAVGAYQDLRVPVPKGAAVVECLKLLETVDGAWANDPIVRVGSTNATAAAVTLLRQLGGPVRPEVGQWLLARFHKQGGFCAAPDAPIPDLLSTATSLHALAGAEIDFEPFKEACLDYIDSLWTNEGSFHGNWTDDDLDTEYTFYGLLALGHLSL